MWNQQPESKPFSKEETGLNYSKLLRMSWLAWYLGSCFCCRHMSTRCVYYCVYHEMMQENENMSGYILVSWSSHPSGSDEPTSAGYRGKGSSHAVNRNIWGTMNTDQIYVKVLITQDCFQQWAANQDVVIFSSSSIKRWHWCSLRQHFHLGGNIQSSRQH